MITVVNVIPKSLSGETDQNSQPCLTVSPAAPLHLAATAFAPATSNGGYAPIYVSLNGGIDWSAIPVLPGGNTFTGTNDATLHFASSNKLYVADLRGDTLELDVFRGDVFPPPAAQWPWLLEQRGGTPLVVQPWVRAMTATVGGFNPSNADHLFVASSDFSAPHGDTATVDCYQDAAAPWATFTTLRLDKRTNASWLYADSVRVAPHASGRVYAAFYGYQHLPDTGWTSAVVVVRDDDWGTGTASTPWTPAGAPFSALVDPSDGIAGRIIAFPEPFNLYLATQRVSGSLALAVHPNDASLVYLAYATSPQGHNTLHLVRSHDFGATWSGDLLAITDATNPAVAVTDTGKVAFLYQQALGDSSATSWTTAVQVSPNGTSWTSHVLAVTPVNDPVPAFEPYLGDYVTMTAVGDDFYGMFSASNVPNRAHFPNGVRFARNANFGTHTLLGVDGTTPVASSIDPYFFKIDTVPSPSLWHTIAHPWAWQPAYDPVPETAVAESLALGRGGTFGTDLYLTFTNPAGDIFFSLYHAGAWVPGYWILNPAATSPIGSVSVVSSSNVYGDMHVVAVDDAGKLWYTALHANGLWQTGFTSIASAMSNDPGPFTSVACAGITDDDDLHVVALDANGKLWHTTRNSSGLWFPVFGSIGGEEENDPSPFTEVSCAEVAGELHVVAIASGWLYHTIRHQDGSWQPFYGWVQGMESNWPGSFTRVACAGINGNLHVMGTVAGNVWHTIRHADGSWQSFYGNVATVESNKIGRAHV